MPWTALAADVRAEVPAFLCGPARVEQDGAASYGMAVSDRFATRGLTLAGRDTACWATLPGTHPDGSTLNVTQVVTWHSLQTQVATATNEQGDRSRVVAEGPGEATIVAMHPSGVSSHKTDDDVTFAAKQIVGLTLTPEDRPGHVGWNTRYALVGTFPDSTTINLTQDACYWVDDGSVARAHNLEGDRSAIELVGPGTTTLHAAFADWIDGQPHVSGQTVSTSLAVAP